MINRGTQNRLWNCKNEFQRDDIKVLCVCSAGLLRSPTLARWLSRTFKNVNPRAVGTSSDHALIPVDEVHLRWADVILCADHENFSFIEDALVVLSMNREVHCLSIPDQFGFGHPALEELIEKKFRSLLETLEELKEEEDSPETSLLDLEAINPLKD